MFVNSVYLSSQNDSVAILLKRLKLCTVNFDKANLNASLAHAYLNKNIDSSKIYLQRALQLFPVDKIYQDRKENLLKVKILNQEADILVKAGKLNEAEKIYYDLLTQHQNYLSINEKAYSLLQLGVVKDYQSNAVASVKYYTKAQNIYDSIRDKKGTSECLNNLAVIYYRQGEIDKGIEYLEKGLELRRGISTKSELADLMINLGSMHILKGDTALAHRYYNEGLEFYKAENNVWGIAYALKNLAKYNIITKNYDEALILCNEILEKYSAPNDSSALCMINSIMAEANYFKGDFKKSIAQAQLAYNIAVKTDVAARVRESTRILKDAYASVNNYKEAYKYYNIYVVMRDSLSNNQTEKETLKQRLEKEKEEERLSHEKDLLIKESEAKRKNLILVFTSAGLIFIMVFSGLLLKKFRETKKQKKIIEEQKTEVEHKQKEIVDSINYAKRIQQTLLPTQKYITKSINRHLR